MEIVDHGLRQLWCDDNSAPKDSGVKIYMEKVSACLEAAGMNVDISEKYFEKLLEEAGFVDIRVFKIKVWLEIPGLHFSRISDSALRVDAAGCVGKGQKV